MFGALLRAAPTALLAALIAAILQRVLNPLLDVMLGGPTASQSDPLIKGLITVGNNSLLIGILSILLALIARAVVEKRVGV
jgi:hypothetical protein